MQNMSFEEAVERITREDGRYAPDAYHFVREALDDSAKLFRRPARGRARHVTGKELLEAFRRRALSEFGPMARRVLKTWGLDRTEDVGEIVFNLVGFGVLGKTPEDSRADFENAYSFDSAFAAPFLPDESPAPKTLPPETSGDEP
jgi:uncharacterized repeat protein (TIGR04138 family)